MNGQVWLWKTFYTQISLELQGDRHSCDNIAKLGDNMRKAF